MIADHQGERAGDTLYLLCFSINRQAYALDLVDVARVLRAVAISPLPNSPTVIVGVANIGGRILPVADMRRRLGFPTKEMHLSDRLLWVIAAGRELLLLVDAVQGVRDFSREELLPTDVLPEFPPSLKGIVRLPQGVLFIQNLAEFLDVKEREALEHALTQY